MNGNKATIVQMIIQAGAVGIAILTVVLFFKFASNHVQHNTEAINNFTTVITELNGSSEAQVKAIDQLTDAIQTLNSRLK